MILGTRSRPRHSIKRTTSMSEFSFDDLSFLDHPQPQPQPQPQPPPPSDQNGSTAVPATPNGGVDQRTLVGLVSPRLLLHRRNSADFATNKSSSSCSFLRSCSLCRCRLGRGRDIFMYKGDTAFCSSECRQQQMAQDEWKEKCVTKQSTSEGDTDATS
ncbi:hypothetical protein RND81_03G054700 [Saponaria officinalis]|uniref:FLZ-type domain-containing protein n=1 Tax=Saponaria officinalis TaxID=3572 RepID=A0AAW1M3N8_SAPOF